MLWVSFGILIEHLKILVYHWQILVLRTYVNCTDKKISIIVIILHDITHILKSFVIIFHLCVSASYTAWVGQDGTKMSATNASVYTGYMLRIYINGYKDINEYNGLMHYNVKKVFF